MEYSVSGRVKKPWTSIRHVREARSAANAKLSSLYTDDPDYLPREFLDNEETRHYESVGCHVCKSTKVYWYDGPSHKAYCKEHARPFIEAKIKALRGA
jgi:hypothetical protein